MTWNAILCSSGRHKVERVTSSVELSQRNGKCKKVLHWGSKELWLQTGHENQKSWPSLNKYK